MAGELESHLTFTIPVRTYVPIQSCSQTTHMLQELGDRPGVTLSLCLHFPGLSVHILPRDPCCCVAES